jgi:hypothetical protein
VLDEAIGQGGLAVIDVGDDAKVTGLAHGPPVRERAANRRFDLAPAPGVVSLPNSPGQRKLKPLVQAASFSHRIFRPGDRAASIAGASCSCIPIGRGSQSG